MALVLANRVQETTTTTGTGTITLAGAVSGYQSFAAIGNGNTTYYTITSGTAWEVGIGTYSTTGPTLARTTILSSSAGGAAITLAGTSTVFVTYPANKSVNYDEANNLTLNNTVSVTGTIAAALGAVATPSYTFTGDTNTGMWSPSADTIAFSEGGVEAMRISNAGFVGIGTNVPAARLHAQNIFDGTSVISRLENLSNVSANTAAAMDFKADQATTRLTSFRDGAGTSSSFSISPSVAGVVTEAVRVTSAGNVGIGTSAPAQRLHVRQDQDGTTAALIQNRNGSGTPISAVQFISGAFDLSDNRYAMISSAGGSNTRLQFWTGQGATPVERMRITDAGNVGIGETVPGARLQVSGGTVGTTAGNLLNVTIDQGVAGGNGVGIRTNLVRVSSGTDWTTTAMRLQGRVDATDFGYIDFVSGGAQGLAFGSGASERMRIDSDGDVGIGTTAPTTILHVQQNNASNIGMRTRQLSTTQFAGAGLLCNGPVSSSTQGGTAFYHYNRNTGGTNGALAMAQFDENGSFQRSLAEYYYNEQAWLFYTNGSERLRIDSSGNVMVGTTSATGLFSVAGLSYGSMIATDRFGILGNNLYYGTSNFRYIGNGHAYGWSQGNTDGADLRLLYAGNNTSGAGAVATTSERIYITAAGNVGIGTSSPSVKLDVNGSANFGAAIVTGTGVSTGDVQFELGSNRSGSGTVYMDLHAVAGGDFNSRIIRYGGTNGGMDIINLGTGGMVLSQEGAAPMVFKTTATERMRIDSSGNVGIGTTGAGYRLDIASGDTSAGLGYAMRLRSNATATAAAIQFTNSAVSTQNGLIACTDTGGMTMQSDGASSVLAFRTNGNERFRILSTGGITSSDLADAVGYKGVPQNSQTASYTLALSDMGKHISITTGGVVIPANGSVAFPIGSTITIYNNSGTAQNISITTDTLRLAGTATSGTRSLAQRGLATCIKVAATEWVVTGNVT